PAPPTPSLHDALPISMKGLRHLLEAVAKLRTERDVQLTVIGKPRPDSGAPRLLRELGIADAVHFVSGVDQERIVELYAEAEVARSEEHTSELQSRVDL